MLEYIIPLAIVLVGLYAVAFKDNVMKKVMGLSIMSGGINLFLVTLGYRFNGVIPILKDLNIGSFAQAAVDPVPQSFVLTSIVINMSITAVGLALIILIYREFKTLDSKKIKELKG